MGRGQQKHDYVSDIWTQLIVLDARFHLLRRRLQVLAYLEADPHFEHGGVALADAFEERSAAALDAELAEDRERAAERVSIAMAGLMCGVEDDQHWLAYLLKRSRLGSRLRPIPSRRRMLMTTLTKSPSMRT